ncbi:MAG: hypothetical protein AAGF56_07275, partial [Pseudomonadota bacterium]
MTTQVRKLKLSSPLFFWLSLLTVIAITVGNAVVIGPVLHDNLAILDNDTVMRLVMIRDWLAGQDWFDTRAYRLVPPDGVLMHWSRYIDAAIGGLIVALSTFLAPDVAQTAAMVIWPTLLSVLLLGVIGFATRHLLGAEAACFALLCALIWPFTSDFYFLPGRIDHHNLQILLIVVITFAIVWPARPVISGAIAGVCAALALAIGLETLPYILVVGALLFARAQMAWTPHADRLLVAFCVTLAVAAVVFWVGQTPRARWGTVVCDQLGLPVLALIGIACVASIVPMWFFTSRSATRFAASLAVVAAGCAIAWPLLGPCLSGPYGSLPVEVQEIISGSIVEAKPALVYAQSNVFNYLKMAVPVFGALLVGAVFWRRMDRGAVDTRQRADLIGQLLILAIVGILASFSQIRLLLMTAAAVPVLVGFVLAVLLQRYLQSRDAGQAVLLLVMSVLLIQPGLVEGPIKAVLPNPPPATGSADANCRDDTALAALNAIPPGVFLTPTNLGPALILNSHHSSLSGPYHRSPAAFANGVVPYQLEAEALRAYLQEAGATHLLVCADGTSDAGFARDLGKGASVEWATPVTVDA